MSGTEEAFADWITAMSRGELERLMKSLRSEHQSAYVELEELRERAARWDEFLRDVERDVPAVRRYTLEQDKLDHIRRVVYAWSTDRAKGPDDMPKRHMESSTVLYHYVLTIAWYVTEAVSEFSTHTVRKEGTVHGEIIHTTKFEVLETARRVAMKRFQIPEESRDSVVVTFWSFMPSELT